MKTRNDYFNGWSTRVIFGSIAWLGTGVLSLLGVIELDLVEQFFLLAPLVITPLGLALVEIPDQARQLQLLYNLIRVAQPQVMRIIHRVSLVGTIAGMPLVAAGITFSPLLEVSGAIGLATSLAMLAFLMIFSTSRVVTHRVGQILLTVSAICLIIGMVFTCLYAVSEFTGYYWVVIPQMVKFHGLTNAFGFALCGLLAGNILHSQRRASSFQPIVEPKPR